MVVLKWFRWLDNVWLRATLLHPILGVTPGIVLSHEQAAAPGAEPNDVDAIMWAVPIGVVAGIGVTVGMALTRQGLSAEARMQLLLVGTLMSCLATVPAFYAWLDAVDVVCGDTYECPF